MVALRRGRRMRNFFRGAQMASCASLALVLLLVVAWPGESDAADRPASPAQLQGLRDQIAGLQAQQQAAWDQMSGLQGQLQSLQAQRDNLRALANRGQSYLGQRPGYGTQIADGATFAAYASQRGLPVGTGGLEVTMTITQLLADIADADAKVQSVQSQVNNLAGTIEAREKQINQLQANLTYWQNPVGADLENERQHLRNLRDQTRTRDDQGHRQWEIENTQRRIKELEDLERQFQQSGPGAGQGTTGQSVQPQSSTYTAPSSGFGASSGIFTGPQGQQPGYGPGPYDTGASPFPTHQQILQGVQGSIGDKPGMSKPGGG